MARTTHPAQGTTVWIPAEVVAVHGLPGQDDPGHCSVACKARDGQAIWTNLGNLEDDHADETAALRVRVADLEDALAMAVADRDRLSAQLADAPKAKAKKG